MTAAALTLPRLLGTRESARRLTLAAIADGTEKVVVNAHDNVSAAQGGLDEVVKTLTELGVQHVVLFNPRQRAEQLFSQAHQRRGAKFLLVVQHRDEALLLRQ